MKILIDGDGCPVVHETLATARRYEIPCFLFCDEAHIFSGTGATVITVSKGPDSVDFALVNRVHAGDIVVTQDYGLAAMCLAKGADVLRQDGFAYTADNIDALLAARHVARKIRNAGGRLKGPKKRTQAQNQAFVAALTALLDQKGAPTAPAGEPSPPSPALPAE